MASTKIKIPYVNLGNDWKENKKYIITVPKGMRKGKRKKKFNNWRFKGRRLFKIRNDSEKIFTL